MTSVNHVRLGGRDLCSNAGTSYNPTVPEYATCADLNIKFQLAVLAQHLACSLLGVSIGKFDAVRHSES